MALLVVFDLNVTFVVSHRGFVASMLAGAEVHNTLNLPCAACGVYMCVCVCDV